MLSTLQLCESAGLLEDGEDGYRSKKYSNGIILEVLAPDRSILLFIAARGAEVSNDHYPFYELLFRRGSTGSRAELLSFQRFYYDVAGIEGFEWRPFFGLLSYLSLIVTLPLQRRLVRSPIGASSQHTKVCSVRD